MRLRIPATMAAAFVAFTTFAQARPPAASAAVGAPTEKLSSADRNFATKAAAADQLKSIATSKDITSPSGESAADEKNTNALEKLNGAASDQKYTQGQRTAHKQGVTLSTESKEAQGSQRKSFANETLHDHLRKMTTSTPPIQKTASKAQ